MIREDINEIEKRKKKKKNTNETNFFKKIKLTSF